MEKTVTLSLQEYEFLHDFAKRTKEAMEDRKIIVVRKVPNHMFHLGPDVQYQEYEFIKPGFLTKKLIKAYNELFTEQEDQLRVALTMGRTVRDNLRAIKRWHEKPWYIRIFTKPEVTI